MSLLSVVAFGSGMSSPQGSVIAAPPFATALNCISTAAVSVVTAPVPTACGPVNDANGVQGVELRVAGAGC